MSADFEIWDWNKCIRSILYVANSTHSFNHLVDHNLFITIKLMSASSKDTDKVLHVCLLVSPAEVFFRMRFSYRRKPTSRNKEVRTHPLGNRKSNLVVLCVR